MAVRKAWLAGAGAAVFLSAAWAQSPEQSAPATGEALGEATAESFAPITGPNPDEMADQLNAQQQIQQTFTVTRTINGEVVETEKRTVTYDRGNPYRETEAGQTAIEALKAAFDREVLTRTEAFEEAKLDFTAGDKDRDGFISEAEFVALASQWRIDDARDPAPDQETARQRQYRAFLDELDPEATQAELEARAKQKFAFMAGAAGALTREDYIREYLLDFDSMDKNRDMLLKANELMQFRAANRGETIAAQ